MAKVEKTLSTSGLPADAREAIPSLMAAGIDGSQYRRFRVGLYNIIMQPGITGVYANHCKEYGPGEATRADETGTSLVTMFHRAIPLQIR